MQTFSWDPADVIDLFNSSPIPAEDFWDAHLYIKERHSLRIELKIWPGLADVDIKLYQLTDQAEPIFSMRMTNCPGARVVQDKRGEFMEFAATSIFSDSYSSVDVPKYGFRLWIDPYIKVEPFKYDF